MERERWNDNKIKHYNTIYCNGLKMYVAHMQLCIYVGVYDENSEIKTTTTTIVQ